LIIRPARPLKGRPDAAATSHQSFIRIAAAGRIPDRLRGDLRAFRAARFPVNESAVVPRSGIDDDDLLLLEDQHGTDSTAVNSSQIASRAPRARFCCRHGVDAR